MKRKRICPSCGAELIVLECWGGSGQGVYLWCMCDPLHSARFEVGGKRKKQQMELFGEK